MRPRPRPETWWLLLLSHSRAAASFLRLLPLEALVDAERSAVRAHLTVARRPDWWTRATPREIGALYGITSGSAGTAGVNNRCRGHLLEVGHVLHLSGPGGAVGFKMAD